jgi:hypothetical protein
MEPMRLIATILLLGISPGAIAQEAFCEGSWGIRVAFGPAEVKSSSVEIIRDIDRAHEAYRDLVLNQGKITPLDEKLSLLGVYEEGTKATLSDDLLRGRRVLLLIQIGSDFLEGKKPTFFLRRPSSEGSGKVAIACADLRLTVGGERKSLALFGEGMFYLVLTNPNPGISWEKTTELQLILPETRVSPADTLRWASPR